MPTATAVIRALGPIDVKSVARDSMLRWMIGTPIVLALVFRWGVPAFDGWLGERYDFDLTPYYPLLCSFLVLMIPNKVQGFALLKGAGVLTWPPVIAWFVASPWQVAIGLDPLYWPLKLFWMLEAGEPRVALYFLAGLGYQGVLIALLLRRFKAVIAR